MQFKLLATGSSCCDWLPPLAHFLLTRFPGGRQGARPTAGHTLSLHFGLEVRSSPASVQPEGRQRRVTFLAPADAVWMRLKAQI